MAFMKRIIIALTLLAACGPRASHGAVVESSLDVYRMDIDCKVTSRFARTLVTMEIQNTQSVAQEAIFDVELPKTAFITNFSMTVDGVTSFGVVKKKEEANQQYDRAVSRGESAGLVQSVGRTMETFNISANVRGGAAAIFKLTYEELLKRHHGNYELQIKVRPKQLVKNFQINVDIEEPQEISFVDAQGTFITNDLRDVVEISHTGRRAHIAFKPTVLQQRTCTDCSETLLDGDFTIKYDVKRETSAGNVQIVNGYFVHYFAPSSLARLPKNVVFVIDCSGSMRGRKIEQTFEAFTKILEDLPEEDHVGILKFNGHVSKWKENLVKAVPDNINSAKEFVAKITAEGGTDIHSALLAAAEMLKTDRESKLLPEISASIIIFLSDGDPTYGITNLDTITKDVKASMEGAATLYSLGFGFHVNYAFLEKMSLENGGLARRIYEDSDSALQLQNFYKEVSLPVLLDVSLQYPELHVDDVTQNTFSHYYAGSELVVAGHIDTNDIQVLTAQVTAQGASEPFSMSLETNIQEEDEISGEQRYAFGDFTERLWAYLTIEQLLTKQISSEGEDKENIREEVLSLCLKYGFVTPLTSMVITNPQDDNREIVANKPKEDDDEPSASSHPHKLLRSRFVAGRSSKLARVVNVTTKKTLIRPKPDLSVALISLAFISDKIFLAIDEKAETWINLLHSPDRDITLNGKLAADGSGFAALGYVNRKKAISVEVAPDNITLSHGQDVQSVSWSSALQGGRFVRKEGRRLILSLDSGFRAVVLRKNPDRLILHVENKEPDSEFPMGLIGQMTTEDNILVESLQIMLLGETHPAERQAVCSFSRFGVKKPASCIKLTLKTFNAFAGITHAVSGAFDVPADP